MANKRGEGEDEVRESVSGHGIAVSLGQIGGYLPKGSGGQLVVCRYGPSFGA